LIPPPARPAVQALRGRITRGEFAVPPELADRDPESAPAEHVGGVALELRAADGLVRLGGTYQQNPLRVITPLQAAPGEPAILFLINSTAGLLDGDRQLVSIEAGPGVRCFVTNQSAGRVHPCPLGHAAARFDLRLAAGSTLCILPGPTIPFAGSRYHQRTVIDLEPGANVVWGDVLLPGRTRYARAPERFAFERLVQELRVRRDGRLVFHERFAWSGPWDEDEIRWHFDDAEAAASLFVSGAVDPGDLPDVPGGETALQPTAAGDTCVRIVGRDAERVIAAAARLALTAAARLAGDPAPWMIDATYLSDNHWFSPPPGPVADRDPAGGDDPRS
jgi:urease accessory protein